MESKSNWSKTKRNEIMRWIAIASIDRETAKIAILINQTGKAVYDLQQSAEKLLKAFLFANDIPVKKTHDIQNLILLAIDADPTIQKIHAVGVGADEMAKFATFYRYPNVEMIDFAESHETVGAIEFVDALYNHLKPFFGDEIIKDALAHGRLPVNPFEDDLTQDVIDNLFLNQKSGRSHRPGGG